MLVNNKKSRVLIIAAHPDDEVLGCGATMFKYATNGDCVRVLILGEGVTSRKELDDTARDRALIELGLFAKKANKYLRVEKVILKNFPDNKFDTVPTLDIIYEIEQVISDFKPNVIYTHSASDVNVDHRRTLEAVESAVRPSTVSPVMKVLSFEIPSSTNWNFVRKHFAPNTFNRINSKALQKKILALKAYKSEIRFFPHPRSSEYLIALAKVRGSQAGFELAEAFEVVMERSI